MSDQQKRYVPPHRRAENSSFHHEDQTTNTPYPGNRPQNPGNQRFQKPHYQRHAGSKPTFQHRFGNETFIVTFKTSKFYEEADLPAVLLEHVKPERGVQSYKFKVVFHNTKLRTLMRWFRNAGRTDSYAVLEFPPSLTKDHRKEIHQMADDFCLGTSSQGFGDMRFITVYATETAAHGDVGKISLTMEEKQKSKEVWFLVCKMGGEYSKFSHNEIIEMIFANKLDPLLQDLLDKNKDLLESEFESKCKVSEKTSN